MKKVDTIIMKKDVNQIEYLQHSLKIKTNNVGLQISQSRAIEFLGDCQNWESVDLIIDYHQKTTNPLFKERCLMALSKIGSRESVQFLVNQLGKTEKDISRVFLYSRLFEMYFLDKLEGKELIYQAFNELKGYEQLIPEKNIILLLEGYTAGYEELDKIVSGQDYEMQYEFAKTLGLSRINNLSLIKKNNKLVELIKKLHQKGDDQIRFYTSRFIF